MNAIHQEWLHSQAQQASTPRPCHELGVCHGRPGPGCTYRNDTTRHYARTLDEAFKTPAWRTPVQGPYRRGSRLRAHLARHALRWALLLLGAALLIEGLA